MNSLYNNPTTLTDVQQNIFIINNNRVMIEGMKAAALAAFFIEENQAIDPLRLLRKNFWVLIWYVRSRTDELAASH